MRPFIASLIASVFFAQTHYAIDRFKLQRSIAGIRVTLFLFLTAILFHCGHAVAEQALLSDGEARLKSLSLELRCLVCQNQTIYDSTSPVAADMRAQIRKQIVDGKSDNDIKQYMTDRFGDFVLYKPQLKATTIVLWAGPFVALALAGLLLIRRLLRRSSTPSATPLNDIDRERARALLNDTPTP